MKKVMVPCMYTGCNGIFVTVNQGMLIAKVYGRSKRRVPRQAGLLPHQRAFVGWSERAGSKPLLFLTSPTRGT